MQLATVLLLAVMTSATAWADDVVLDGSNSYTVNDGDVLTGSTSGTVTIADGAKITLNEVTINGGIVCAGTAEITLVGTNSVTGPIIKAGIQVGSEGTTLTINGDGSLTAQGGSSAAGIGTNRNSGGSTSLGNITINGGTVTAIGGANAPGIGTGRTFNNGSTTSLGNITINGGTVTATGDDAGAGIGTGYTFDSGTASVGNITINGGTVTATGSNTGAGIGTGYVYNGSASVGNITIKGGTVTATAGKNAAGIGLGKTISGTSNIGSINIYYDYHFNMVDASSFSKDITYMKGETDVTANANDYFSITTEDGRNIIKCLYTVQDGEVLTGSTSSTLTIAAGLKITLSGVTFTGGIVCAGTAEITLVGTNSVTGPSGKAAIQVGGTGTTLTIKGDGALTATGGDGAAGIGLSTAGSNCTGGNVVIESGTITALGGTNAAGIGTGLAFNANVALGNITIKDGTVTATGGNNGDGIGTGYTFGGNGSIGTVTVYVGVDMIDASSIKNFGSTVYMYGEYNVTANASDFFNITVDGSHCVIVTDNPVTLADGTAYNWIYDPEVTSATYVKTLGEERVGKYQTWFVPFDYTITSDDEDAFTFYKINMIANAPNPSTEATDDIWVFLRKLEAGDVLHGNMPYVYKPKQAVTDYNFTTLNTVLKAKANDARITMMTAEDTYTVYGTYENTTATAQDPFYYVNINGDLSLGNDGSVTVGPYRWIMRVENKFGGSPAYVKAVHFFDGEDETTGIGLTSDLSLSKRGEGEWYSIDGSRLDGKPTKSGIYLVGGRKVVIR